MITRKNAYRSLLFSLALLFIAFPAVFPQQRTTQTDPDKRVMQKSAADWWKLAVYYEIYPRSFYDTNGDGIGDLNGITAKLDYLQDLGVDAIWITPFYPSPQVDFGYDVSDYENVDPQFGTLADFDRLVQEAHKRDIKVICDYVINHTSDQHPFFKESRSSRDNPKRDWYVWHDPKPNGDPPNNWSSAFGPTAWTIDEKTKQYYYHFFYAEQPDLNWRNQEVANAMFNSVRFWFKRGVDGFRVDAIDTLFEDPQLRDNPVTNKLREGSKTEYQQEHKYNEYLTENHSRFKDLRAVADEFGPDRVLIAETYPLKLADLLTYYGSRNDEFHMPFNFSLLKQPKLDAAAFRRTVGETENVLQGRPTNYVLSNHDNPRAFDKFGDGKHNDEIAKLLALISDQMAADADRYWHMLGATILVAATLHWPFAKTILGSRTGRFLGKISFVLYLIQVPIICSLTSWVFLTLAPVSVSIAAKVAALSTVAVIFAVSAATCRFIDQAPTRLSRAAGRSMDALLSVRLQPADMRDNQSS